MTKKIYKPIDHLGDMSGSLWTIANETVDVSVKELSSGEVEERLAGIENQLTILGQNVAMVSKYFETMIELYAKVNADHIAQSEVLLKLKKESNAS